MDELDRRDVNINTIYIYILYHINNSLLQYNYIISRLIKLNKIHSNVTYLDIDGQESFLILLGIAIIIID